MTGNTVSRRQFNLATLAFLGLFDGNSDENLELGYFDTHIVANDGNELAVDPAVLDFVGAINARETQEGVEIALDKSQVSPRPTSLGLPNHHINYASGLSNEEIARFSLDDDEKLELWRLEVKFKGGGTNSDFTVDVYDATDGSVIGSTSDKITGGDSPIGSSTAGAEIIVRVSNATGRGQDACISGIMDTVTV